jgi:SAM-dependent methyltransferase
MSPEDLWSDVENAKAYARFVRDHPAFGATSRDVVAAAGCGPHDRAVVDLGCGTGATTAEVLKVVGPATRVIAIDASAAMLAEGRSAIDDPRVEWVQGRLEAVGQLVEGASVDCVVSNSAVGHGEMVATFRGVRRILRPGGCFAFNIPRQFLVLPYTDDELNPAAPSISELLRAFAVVDHNHTPAKRRAPAGSVVGAPWRPEQVARLVTEAGLVMRMSEERRYPDSLERQRGRLSVPIFTDWLSDLTYDQRMDALAKAYERADKTVPLPPTRWVLFVAEAPGQRR